MDTKKCIETLGSAINENGLTNINYNYVDYIIGIDNTTLDGDFTLLELEAMVYYIKNSTEVYKTYVHQLTENE